MAVCLISSLSGSYLISGSGTSPFVQGDELLGRIHHLAASHRRIQAAMLLAVALAVRPITPTATRVTLARLPAARHKVTTPPQRAAPTEALRPCNRTGNPPATWSPRWPGLLSLRGSLHEGPQPSGRIPPPSTAIPRYQHGPRGGCRSRGPRDPRCARPGNASWSSDGRARFAGFRRQHGTRCPRGQAREPGQIHSQGWLVEMWPRPSSTGVVLPMPRGG
jgi:hypothetical protein